MSDYRTCEKIIRKVREVGLESLVAEAVPRTVGLEAGEILGLHSDGYSLTA